jgi:hypothetical protein
MPGKATATPKKDPQTKFEEKTLEDPELVELLDERDLSKPAAARSARTNNKLKELIASRGLVDGVRYRVDGWVFRLSTNTRESHDVAGGTTRRFAELKSDSDGDSDGDSD